MGAQLLLSATALNELALGAYVNFCGWPLAFTWAVTFSHFVVGGIAPLCSAIEGI
jgi:hypothetical protein